MISHQSTTDAMGSNETLFNRVQILSNDLGTSEQVTQELANKIAKAYPVSARTRQLLSTVSVYEFGAAAILYEFISTFSSYDGSGLFTGSERYNRLSSRAQTAAQTCETLLQFWGKLLDSMKVSVPTADQQNKFMAKLSLFIPLEKGILSVIRQATSSTVAIARELTRGSKMSNEAYAEAVGEEAEEATASLEFDISRQAPRHRDIVHIPHVQANSLRHAMVRHAGFKHLAGAIGIPAQGFGQGILPSSVEALLLNGGNIKGGSKEPANAQVIASIIREKYPLLDLLSGCLDSFQIGDGRLKVACWVVCKENRRFLEGTPAEELCIIPGAELLTTQRMTRRGVNDIGQMIFGGEALIAGAQIYVRMTIDRFSKPLTRGALYAALSTFEEDGYIGGQARAGFGSVDMKYISREPNADELMAQYENYLTSNASELLEGLRSGTLCTDTTVLS